MYVLMHFQQTFLMATLLENVGSAAVALLTGGRAEAARS
jgi:hypothetical protein